MLEARFEKFVELACKELGLKQKPRIFFLEGYIPENPNWKACIDVLSWTIFVSRIHLNSMSVEEVRETAIHEVTHLLGYGLDGHDLEFFKMHRVLKYKAMLNY